MRDNGTPTKITTRDGSPIYIADKACTACGCFEAFVFECNCGAVHSDVCYNCGGFVDVQHKPIEERTPPHTGIPRTERCAVGQVEHKHGSF